MDLKEQIQKLEERVAKLEAENAKLKGYLSGSRGSKSAVWADYDGVLNEKIKKVFESMFQQHQQQPSSLSSRSVDSIPLTSSSSVPNLAKELTATLTLTPGTGRTNTGGSNDTPTPTPPSSHPPAPTRQRSLRFRMGKKSESSQSSESPDLNRASMFAELKSVVPLAPSKDEKGSDSPRSVSWKLKEAVTRSKSLESIKKPANQGVKTAASSSSLKSPRHSDSAGNHLVNLSGAPAGLNEEDGFHLELGTNQDELFSSLKPVNNSFLRPQIEESAGDDPNFLKKVFCRDHTNFLGEDETIGPIIISCVRTKTDDDKGYTAIVRTRKGNQVVSIPDRKSRKKRLLRSAGISEETKLVEVESERLSTELLQYERETINAQRCYKFGVLLAKDDQTEDQMFSNDTTPDFDEFLSFLGDKIDLLGWVGFRGGLDVKNNTTGSNSVYTKFQGFEVMFHVSTMLPYFPTDSQQLERKRHIGNDVVVIIFREGTKPISPYYIRSHFNYVFIIITKVHELSGNGSTTYEVAIASKNGVDPFGPLLPNPPRFAKDDAFRNFLLTKMINAERSAMHAPSFARKLMRTKTEQLRDYIVRYSPKKGVKKSASVILTGLN